MLSIRIRSVHIDVDLKHRRIVKSAITSGATKTSTHLIAPYATAE